MKKAANWKIATYALYLLEGTSKQVHTEDIAVKCYELAPQAFSWIKYRQYPDKDIARIALMDAMKEKHGALVSGRSGKGTGHWSKSGVSKAADGWQLTEAGVQWVMANEQQVALALGQTEPSTHRQLDMKRLSRVIDHPLFARYREQPQGFVPDVGEMAEMMRCRVDAAAHVWAKRFQTYRNLAQALKDEAVLDFLRVCERFLWKLQE